MKKKSFSTYVDEKLIHRLKLHLNESGETMVDYMDRLLRREFSSKKEKELDVLDYMKITSRRLQSIDAQQVIIIEMIYKVMKKLITSTTNDNGAAELLEFGTDVSESLIEENTFLGILERMTEAKIKIAEKGKKLK